MNIELRWVERRVVLTQTATSTTTKLERVLQYRERDGGAYTDDFGCVHLERWSDWRDVPVEAE